jgi:hypothetical protein
MRRRKTREKQRRARNHKRNKSRKVELGGSIIEEWGVGNLEEVESRGNKWNERRKEAMRQEKEVESIHVTTISSY